MKKNRSHMIVLTWHKQASITYISLQRNKDFWISLEQANKMMSRFLLLCPFSLRNVQKIYGIVFNNTQICTNVFNALSCKVRLAWLCAVFADPVTYIVGRNMWYCPALVLMVVKRLGKEHACILYCLLCVSKIIIQVLENRKGFMVNRINLRHH